MSSRALSGKDAHQFLHEAGGWMDSDPCRINGNTLNAMSAKGWIVLEKDEQGNPTACTITKAGHEAYHSKPVKECHGCYFHYAKIQTSEQVGSAP